MFLAIATSVTLTVVSPPLPAQSVARDVDANPGATATGAAARRPIERHQAAQHPSGRDRLRGRASLRGESAGSGSSRTDGRLAPLDPGRWLPASTVASLSFAGLDRCAELRDDLEFLALLENKLTQFAPQLARRIAPTEFGDLPGRVREIRRKIDRQLQSVGLDSASVRGLLAGPMVIGIGRLTLSVEAPMPSLALLFDCREDRSRSEKVVGVIEAAIRNHGRHFGGRVARSMDGQAVRLGQGGGQGPVIHSIDGAPFYWTEVDGVLIASQSFGCVVDCVRAHRGQVPSADASGMATRRQSSGHTDSSDPVAQVRLYGEPIRRTVSLVWPYEVERIAHAVGIDGFDGAEFVTKVGTDGEDVTELRWIAPMGSDGMLRSAFGGPVDHEVARLFASDTMVYGSMRLDFDAVFAGIERCVSELPAQARRQLMRAHGELSRFLNRGARGTLELVRAIGPQVSFGVTSPLRGGLPEVLVAIDCQQPEVLAKHLEGMVGRAIGRRGVRRNRGRELLAETEFRGHAIRYLKQSAAMVPVRPAMAAVDGRLLIGSSLLAVKAALRRFEAGTDDRTLAAEDDFRAATAAETGASVFGLARVREQVMPVYRAFLAPMAVRMVERELGLDADFVPTPEELGPTLSASRLGIRVDEGGVVVRARGALGPASLIAAGAGLLDHLLAGTTAATRRKPKGKVY